MDKNKHHQKKEEHLLQDSERQVNVNVGQETSSSKDEYAKKAAEYDALWDKYLRLCAEFDNARKRWEKERQNLVKFAHYELIKKLIVVLDELEQAKEAIRKHKTGEDIARGVEITYNNLINLLKKEGLRPVEAKGKKFDPHLHEIVGQRRDEAVEEHTVLEEVQKGYFLGDNLLRTAKVIIAVKDGSSQTDGKDEENNEESNGEEINNE